MSPRAQPPVTAVQPEVLLAHDDDAQFALQLATAGVLRYVWQSRYGPILVEVQGDTAFVNGQRVEPAAPALRPSSPPCR